MTEEWRASYCCWFYFRNDRWLPGYQFFPEAQELFPKRATCRRGTCVRFARRLRYGKRRLKSICVKRARQAAWDGRLHGYFGLGHGTPPSRHALTLLPHASYHANAGPGVKPLSTIRSRPFCCMVQLALVRPHACAHHCSYNASPVEVSSQLRVPLKIFRLKPQNQGF